MDNTKMQRQSESGQSLRQQFSQQDFLKVAGIINELRLIQGWNMLDPEETQPIAAAWMRRLARHKLTADHCPRLMEKVLDWRMKCLREGTEPPPLTIETLIAASFRA